MNAITTRTVDGATVATLHDEHGNPAFSWIADDCAPEGGQFREPQPAPLSLAQRIALEFCGWLPYAAVIGTFSALFALALRTH